MTSHPSPPQANGPVLPAVPVAPVPGPTAACLMERRDQLTRFLRRRGFNEYVIERAIDRVIWAAMSYLPGGNAARPLRNRLSWLFGSALKAARQEAKRQSVCTFIDPASLASAVATQSDDAVQETVWAALEQLSDPQRQAVYLCVMRGLTSSEAAAVMGCVRATVLHHRNRGLQRLRHLLTPPRSGEKTSVH